MQDTSHKIPDTTYQLPITNHQALAGGNRGKTGGKRGIFGENRVNPPLRIDMTHLVGFRKGLPRPANQCKQAGLPQMFTSRKGLPKYTKAVQSSVSSECSVAKKHLVILSQNTREISGNQRNQRLNNVKRNQFADPKNEHNLRSNKQLRI